MISIILLVVSAVALYLYTGSLLENEIEEELYSNKDRVEQLLIKDNDLKGIPPIMMVEKVGRSEREIIKDTLLYDPMQDEIELFRQLSGTKTIDGQNYRVTVRAMVIESEDILFAIVFIFVTIIFLAFIFLFYINKSRNEKLWKPFFVNLDKLKDFSLKSGKPLQLNESDIVEFDDLNREMLSLTTKVQADYRNLKQFTEDVSHEMQTPLAIMQAKIETIINDQHISDNQFEHLSSLQSDIQRLKQLNKRLILLAKINNNQFTDNKTVSINEVFEHAISNFHELTSVQIKSKGSSTINITMDRSLASVLCNNLLSNAVKHNIANNPITVFFEENRVRVTNSGTKALNNPDHIFDRFYKESKKPDSTGLGLSIVKKICDYYGFVPSYRYEKNNHVFQVDFVS